MLLAPAFDQPLSLPLLILAAALILDALFGDPHALYRRLPHPVVLIGKMVALGESWWNAAHRRPVTRRWRGAMLVAVAAGGSAALGFAAARLCAAFAWGWLLEAVFTSILLAGRSLDNHVRAVAEGLAQGSTEGRRAVARIVGRDPDSLDAAGVARAAAESLAENFSDGVVAPAFWFLLFGLPGLAAYKAVNTLDSMIGHRTARYLDFGWAAARLDDLVNLVPARLTGLLLAATAVVLPGADAGRALATMLRDARRHRSPNAGWPEAAMAGALGFRLAGPRRYGGETVEEPWLGDGRAALDAADIHSALWLYRAANLLLLLLILLAHLSLSFAGQA